MAKTDSWENGLALLLFNNTDYTLVGDAGGLRGSVTAGSLYVSLHTADPGETGTQLTNEAAYTSYAREAVARSAGGWTVTANSVSPTAVITFTAATGGSETETFFGVGTDSTGAGKLLYRGAISPTIAVSSGVTPQLGTGTVITEA